MAFSRALAVVGRRVGEGCGGRGGELVLAGLAECGGHGGALVHAEPARSCFTIAAISQVHAEQHRADVGRKAQRSIAVVVLRIDDMRFARFLCGLVTVQLSLVTVQLSLGNFRKTP